MPHHIVLVLVKEHIQEAVIDRHGVTRLRLQHVQVFASMHDAKQEGDAYFLATRVQLNSFCRRVLENQARY